MAVGVVEFLEVIDVAHRQYIVATQALHAFIERATARQSGEFIAEGHLISLMRNRGGDHQHHLTAHDVQGKRQDERFRQHPEHTEQTHQLRRMQRTRVAPVLPGQQQERRDEHWIRELNQTHPRAV
ncbi:hypothetical protein D3C81_1465020 [compost metagenome]